jgi:beta-glucosidase
MPKQVLPLAFLLIPALCAVEPEVAARKAPLLKVDGRTFKDLNRNGVLDKYEDWRLPVDARVADLLSKMTLEEKAGLMIHSSLMGFTGPNGVVLDAPAPGPAGPAANPTRTNIPGVAPMDRPTPAELVLKRNVRWILVRPAAQEAPEITAKFSNGMQEMAEGSRLGIPISFSSDPRHTPRRIPNAPVAAGPPVLSQWPEQIAFGAIGDPNVVREFGRIAAQELRALGIQATLSPMADVTTEPRWNRIPGTFGEDVKLDSLLVKAYIEGFQGQQLSASSVMCVTKHFPGDGPVKDGLDPHNDYGKWQVYPGKNFDSHLLPFQAAFEAGTGGIMPGYAIPVGVDTVGMNFSKIIVTDLLRKKFGYTGLVITDWLRSMPWGVENLSEKDRQRRIVEAGVDQIGGDNDPIYILELVKEGSIPETRIDESARRVLKPMFQLGLFENPYVDPARAKSLVASPDFLRAGELAQRKSVVLLKNADDLLPLPAHRKLYVENISKTAAAKYGSPVDDLKAADVALIKVDAPYALHPGGGSFFARGVHEGTLAYAGAENAKELAAIQRLTASGKPVVVLMFMDRPAILTEFLGDAAAVLAHFASGDEALLDVVFGRFAPVGKLPFDLPRDMASVQNQMADMPFDLQNPLFKFGFGLTYAKK